MIAILRKQTVYNLFKEYFGEDKVDMQGNNILVWWPELPVSNERGEFCFIKNLYAKVRIEDNGSLAGTFTLNRTEYTYDEWITGYCHSHVERVQRDEENIKLWRHPCLGTGPIRETSCTLNAGFDEDIWRLFIFELDQYVRHESVEGVPYIRLNTIGTDIYNSSYEWHIPIVYTRLCAGQYDSQTIICSKIINHLIQRVVELKPFRFNWVNGCYGIAENPLDIVIKVSDIFIDWYNTLPAEEQKDIMEFLTGNAKFRKCKIVNNKILIERTSHRSINYNLELEGTDILTFKGEGQKLKISNKPDNNTEFTQNYLRILDPNMIMYVIHKILRTINYRFNGSDKKRASCTKEAVRYF